MNRRRTFVGLIVLLSFLLMGKFILGGIYLRSGSSMVEVVPSVHADEMGKAAVVKIPPGERLAKKERELAEREERLRQKEAELLPLKEEVETRISDLNDLQERLTALARDLTEKERGAREEKIGHLVSLYSAMEPDRAAAIMGKLKLDTIVLILRNMKGKSAGQILSLMDPVQGAMISEELSRIE
jgi:flagellar motility protein MotE (MotC chaperone)